MSTQSIQPISAPVTQTPEQQPTSSSHSRYTFPFSIKQGVVLLSIGYFIINPTLGAVTKALDFSRVSAIPPATLNATCPILQISPQVIQEYLQDGTASYFTSIADRQLQQLGLTEYDEYEEESKLFNEAKKDYFRIADQEEHPVARAIALHQAKEIVQRAGVRIKDGRDAIKELRVKEAGACADAALLTKDPYGQLQWVIRGLNELKLPLSDEKEWACTRPYNTQKCMVASTLWTLASQAFLQLPLKQFPSLYSIDQLKLHSFDSLEESEVYAAKCLQNAAHCIKNTQCLGAEDIALGDHEEAIRIMKSIDTTQRSLTEKAQLQDEIFFATLSAYQTADSTEERVLLKKKVYSEAMTAQDIYSQDPTYTYFTIKRAVRLEAAAYYSESLKECRDRLKEAQSLVQNAWQKDELGCRINNEFDPDSYRYSFYPTSFKLENTLLGRLNAKLEKVEKEIAQDNSVLRPLYFVWNAMSGWLPQEEN